LRWVVRWAGWPTHASFTSQTGRFLITASLRHPS